MSRSELSETFGSLQKPVSYGHFKATQRAKHRILQLVQSISAYLNLRGMYTEQDKILRLYYNQLTACKWGDSLCTLQLAAGNSEDEAWACIAAITAPFEMLWWHLILHQETTDKWIITWSYGCSTTKLEWHSYFFFLPPADLFFLLAVSLTFSEGSCCNQS